MRTTLTIEDEIADRLRQEMRLGKRPMKLIVNEALRRGLGLESVKKQKSYRVKPHASPFLPGVDTGRLNQLVDDLEAEAFLAKHPPRS